MRVPQTELLTAPDKVADVYDHETFRNLARNDARLFKAFSKNSGVATSISDEDGSFYQRVPVARLP
ncbi:hypothetical protein [Nakamurella antarctica]|uniref:hypothetical protein n=1 Tax=Nakamurella antarctica TaxID=1902245 RepID=UPI0030D4CFD6